MKYISRSKIVLVPLDQVFRDFDICKKHTNIMFEVSGFLESGCFLETPIEIHGKRKERKLKRDKENEDYHQVGLDGLTIELCSRLFRTLLTLYFLSIWEDLNGPVENYLRRSLCSWYFVQFSRFHFTSTPTHIQGVGGGPKSVAYRKRR